MSRNMRRLLPAAGGLLVGLCLGLSITVGVLLCRPSATAGVFDELRLKGVASSSTENFAMATGQIEEDVEGVYCLDYLTGDLYCYILNPRTGLPGGIFKTNVVADLPVEKGKKPAYAMVTGSIQARAATGNFRPALSVVYVADTNTGNVVGYNVLWNRSISAADVGQKGDLKRVFFAKARSLELRE